MTAAMRSKRRDKLVPRLRVFLLQNFAPVWRTVERVPPLARMVNRLIINTACNTAAFRPHAMSTLGDYTSWSSLTDRTYLGRMIPPLPAAPRDGPSLAETTALFAPQGPQQQCPKSTLLFPIFAQYLTDGFLRTSSTDRARTTSNHDIDLSPLYGRTPAQTLALRAAPDQGGGKGRLKSQWIGDEEFPPDLYRTDTSDIAADFADAHGAALLDLPLGMNADPPWAAGEHSRRRLFAVGGDRVNSTALVAMLNTLFLREHNRLAAELERRNPGWDDTRIFETARNIVIVLFIKIVIEEYINHISSACFRLRADPRVAWNAPWNKPNWMTVEFSLLYRWHSLVPETMLWDGERMDTAAILLDNRKLIEAGLAKAFKWAGQTPAARLGLHNTAIYLENRLTVESRAIEQNRARRLPGYNAYRQAMGMNPVDDFDCMTGDRARQEELRALYGTPEAVDFYVGLFAEDAGLNTPMPPLLGAMVALDAFSQALNNPLLSRQVYCKETFTGYGLEVIEATGTLWDVLVRNLGPAAPSDIRAEDVRMTRPDWRRRFSAF
ncbi:peroxidase family protein [Cereibacter johrii]|uniref:peroxidase family protein n=1 Tax=Cereibacter johrii TaxID=445629 RepID=UPI000DCC8648|nr:peroxidase family protein [Cereibacter johrii]RAZ87102.1 heme peroxidase [Cereibacter johrii]